jgi:hypothetical protein
MASWNEPTHEDPLAFFVGLKNGLLITCPFWLVVCVIAAAILTHCK